jgi:hypothetical protein
MHNYGTCKLNSRALWQIPIHFAIKHFFETQLRFENCLQNGILELFKLCTTLDPALNQIVIRGVRSKTKMGAQCLVSSDMLERWLQVFIVHITLTLLPFHVTTNQFDEIHCELDTNEKNVGEIRNTTLNR